MSANLPTQPTPPLNATRFEGLWLPLITPFRNGLIDHPALQSLTQHYCTHGIAGLVVCGSTGEAAALDDDEQLAVLATVLQAVQTSGHQLPVVMGASGYHLGQMVAWVKRLAAYPLAGLLVPAPHYIRPSQAGLLHWFNAIADAAAQPLILYDIPYRTGVDITQDTLISLAAHPNIGAIKDCGGNPAKTLALIADTRLAVLVGDDANILRDVSAGATGAIAASAHLQTAAMARLIQHLRQGQPAEAERLWSTLQPQIAALFATPNPASIKAALAGLGLIANELRAPMLATDLPPAGTWTLV